MNEQQFLQAVNPNHRGLVVYRDDNGERRRGILLAENIMHGVGDAGVPFVYVNNFATRVRLEQIERVEDTGSAWV